MKPRYGIVATALIASLALTVPALAAGGKGQAAQTQTRSTNQIQKQQRVRDGSCTQSKTKSQTGNTYGRGANTSNQGSTTQTRSGYGK